MAAERKPGSDLGRAATDWNAAFLTYASLPAPERTYQAVADAHAVSVRTVERHGREEQWMARAAALDREVQALAASRLADERASKIGDLEKLIDATLVYYAGQIRDGKVKMNPGDLGRLHQLRLDLWADEPDTTDSTEPTTTPPAVDTTEHKLEVLRALHDAGVLADPTPNQPEPAGDGDGDEREVA